MRRQPLADARVREIAGGYSLTHDLESVPLAEEVLAARRDAADRLLSASALKRLKQRIARSLYDPLKPASLVRREVASCIDEWQAAERKRGAR